MNFTNFWTKLEALEKTIAITSPVTLTVKKAHWGTPGQSITDLPVIVNTMSEPDRILGFGSRDQRLRIGIQCLVARTPVEDERSSTIATALWYAAKDKFDKDITITGTVSFSTLKGGDPTVPVLLQHGGQAYIGFNAVLEVHDFEGFTF
jgi:hypothetical protein